MTSLTPIRALAAPVVLVIDAARAGRSVAALASGFAAFDSRKQALHDRMANTVVVRRLQ